MPRGDPAAPICRTESIRLEADRFRVERVTYESEGRSHARDVIRHGGSVVIVPLLSGPRICLIRNFRVSIGRSLVELPAGTLDAGEAPAAAAVRELHEETGFHTARIQHINSFYAAPGILDEQMHLFLAEELTAGSPRREENEIIENLIVPWSEALNMIRDGQIEDAKSMIGLLYVHQFLALGTAADSSSAG